jgi:hypothetical protein
MSSANTSEKLPDFGKLRGLDPKIIDLCKIKNNGRGWNYPCVSLNKKTATKRWKAAPGHTGQKYVWKPGKPKDINFYDPDGGLVTAVAESDGLLYLTGGDVATMSMFHMGIRHATNTFGDKLIHKNFLKDLKYLAVDHLIITPRS